MTDNVATASDGMFDREGSSADAFSSAGCARVDASDFDGIVEAHRRRITRLVYRLLGWSDDAEDVVQEVFLSALKNIKAFRGESGLSTWLMRIAVNKCRSHRRSLRVRLRLLAGAAERVRRTRSARPEDASADAETFRRVRRAVRALPVRYREVVVLRYLEETPTTEVAEILGISQAAVDTRLHRARRRLKDLLGDIMED